MAGVAMRQAEAHLVRDRAPVQEIASQPISTRPFPRFGQKYRSVSIVGAAIPRPEGRNPPFERELLGFETAGIRDPQPSRVLRVGVR